MNVYEIIFKVLENDTREIKQRIYKIQSKDFDGAVEWALAEQKEEKHIGESLELLTVHRIISGLHII